MYLLLRTLSCAVLLSCVCHLGQAAERGNAEDAVALVKKAIAYGQKNGKNRLVAEVMNRKGLFVYRDLYLTITDMKGDTLVNGNNVKLNGKNVLALRDVDGKYFVRERLEKLKSATSGWVDYKWPDAIDGHIMLKSAYFEKYDDMVIACGVYGAGK